MSKVTGVADFKDFVQVENFDYLKNLKYYIGYSNYLFDIPIEIKDFTDKEDFAPLYHYTILTKSLYRASGNGYVVLSDRDYLSRQEDTQAGKGYSSIVKKIHERRDKFKGELISYGYEPEDAEYITKYKFELDERHNNEANEPEDNKQA